MLRVAYLFERFPSFGQTFCYREVAELARQGAELRVFSIRRPIGEPAQDWDEQIVREVIYLPEEAELVAEIKRATRAGELPDAAARAIKEWDRQSDFLRLYQAAWVGLRLQKAGIRRVHAHFAGMAARTAYWIRQFFGIQFSLTAHANDIFAPRDFVVSLPKMFETATAVVTVSDFAVAQLKEKFPEHAAKFHRVYNGVDAEKFSATAGEKAERLILSIGRLIEKKGFDDFIAACALLKWRGVAFRCEVIGEGPLAEALSAQISGTQLQDSVVLTGPRTQKQIAQRLDAATVFVLPCKRDAKGDMDNLPTVIMEAMAAGLPVVSTNLAGIPEMVQPGVNGELVAAADPGALADAIETIISNPVIARRLGEQGRVLAAEKFGIAENVTALAEILSAQK